ncbi:MAG: CDP-alcohol phosphatidyltransferase family protein, partial [Paenibacillaceae bacterium]|nr:CDP-alcohol phosphatidyltransferase family protein [Paenibacillaceae bacterium]
MNLANRITVVRILLVPVMMVVLLVNVDVPELRLGDFAITWNQLLGTVIFVVAALSDGLDGYIARSRKMVTRLGTLLDPLADKLLIATVLIALV